jgi:hypothetical protein
MIRYQQGDLLPLENLQGLLPARGANQPEPVSQQPFEQPQIRRFVVYYQYRM